MIACMSNEKNKLISSSIETLNKKENFEEIEEKKESFNKKQKNSQSSPKLNAHAQQRQQEKRTFPFFRYEDQNRLNSLRNIINSVQKGKPIRLYLENIPNFANEFDFEERCRGLLTVVWNHKRANACFILVENKEYAIEVLEQEPEIPPYCKEGRIFVSRVEENSILYAKKPNPKRFETYFNLSDDSGFFIVENDKMKYFWYDQNGGFYDEFGIYYNQKGRPSPPPYINSRAGRSRKGNRGNSERNNQRNQNQNSEQKQSSPKLNAVRQQPGSYVEYVKKSEINTQEQQNNQNNRDNSNGKNNYQQIQGGNNENNLVLQQQSQDNKQNNNNFNRPKSQSSGSNNNKGNNYNTKQGTNQNNNNNFKQGRNKNKNNENERKGNGTQFNYKNEDGGEKGTFSTYPQHNGNTNGNNYNGGYQNRKKSSSFSQQSQ